MSFNGGGTKANVFGSGVVRGLAIEPGGGIVAGGYTSATGPPQTTSVAAARLLATGAPDTAFGTVGISSANSGASKDIAVKVALLPSGHLVAAGSCTRITQVEGAVARYAPNGTLDPAFGTQGILTPATIVNLQSVAATAGGDILVMGPPGLSGWGFKVGRYDTSGALDSSFGQNGTTPAELTMAGSVARTMLVDPQGRIVVGGHTTTDLALIRFLPTGQLDASFDQDGRVTTPAMFPRVDAIALQQDGKILLGGAETPTPVVARYDSSGLLDPSFGTGGKASLPINAAPGAIIELSSGAVLLAGHNLAQAELYLMRLTAAGSVDAIFGNGGKVSVFLGVGITPFSPVLKGPGLVVLPNDNIVVAGIIAEGSRERLLMMRFLPDGTPDASFGPGGQVVIPTGPGSFNALDMLRQPDGRLVIAGRGFSPDGGTDFALVRLMP